VNFTPVALLKPENKPSAVMYPDVTGPPPTAVIVRSGTQAGVGTVGVDAGTAGTGAGTVDTGAGAVGAGAGTSLAQAARSSAAANAKTRQALPNSLNDLFLFTLINPPYEFCPLKIH